MGSILNCMPCIPSLLVIVVSANDDLLQSATLQSLTCTCLVLPFLHLGIYAELDNSRVTSSIPYIQA